MTAHSPAAREDGRARWARRENERRNASYQHDLTAWQQDASELDWMLATARTFSGTRQASVPLKRGEMALFEQANVHLVEYQSASNHVLHANAGFSFRIAKGIRFRLGVGQSTIVAGTQQLRIADTGTAVVTDQRVVLVGSRNSREWSYSKLLGVNHDEHRPMTLMHVSNRQKVSGLLYEADGAARTRFFLALALAHYQGSVDHFVAELERQRAEHVLQAPMAPKLAQRNEAPARWYGIARGLKTVYFGRSSWPRKRRVGLGVVTVGATIIALSAMAGTGHSKPVDHQTHLVATSHAVAAPSVTASVALSTRAISVVPSTKPPAQPTPKPTTKAASTPTPKPTPVVTTYAPPPSVAPAPPPPATQAPAPHCYPLSNGGNCYEPGEFCRNSDHGAHGIDGEGNPIVCVDNNRWRWEPAG